MKIIAGFKHQVTYKTLFGIASAEAMRFIIEQTLFQTSEF